MSARVLAWLQAFPADEVLRHLRALEDERDALDEEIAARVRAIEALTTSSSAPEREAKALQGESGSGVREELGE